MFGEIYNMANLREKIDYAKQNPESEYAKRLYFFIKKGDADVDATTEGIDLSAFGRAPEQLAQKEAKITNLRTSAERAEEKAQRIASPLGQAKEFVKEIGEFSGITPTGRRLAAGIAPYTEKPEDLPNVVEGLVGGVDTKQKPQIQELAEIAIDLPLISLGLSKTLAGVVEKQAIKTAPELAKFLDKPLMDILSEYAPEELKNIMGKDVGESLKTVKEKIGETFKGGVEKGKEFIKETGIKAKEKITGVSLKTGEDKITEDTLNIVREPITKGYEEKAALDGRTYTEGRTKEVKIKPTRREELVADSVRQLVVDGRIDPKKLPFENIPEIQLEVNRINQGVEQMIYERKIPFNMKQLRSKLSAVKKDADIVFSTDPTLERTYDALIDAFMKNVEKGDTLGLFKARQSFDKIPAVKKLLDGLKGASGENLKRQAVLDIRRAANEYVAEQLPKNDPYRYALSQESYMIEAMGNLAEKSKGLVGSTNISRMLDEYPVLKSVVRQAIPFGVGATVF